MESDKALDVTLAWPNRFLGNQNVDLNSTLEFLFAKLIKSSICPPVL